MNLRLNYMYLFWYKLSLRLFALWKLKSRKITSFSCLRAKEELWERLRRVLFGLDMVRMPWRMVKWCLLEALTTEINSLSSIQGNKSTEKKNYYVFILTVTKLFASQTIFRMMATRTKIIDAFRPTIIHYYFSVLWWCLANFLCQMFHVMHHNWYHVAQTGSNIKSLPMISSSYLSNQKQKIVANPTIELCQSDKSLQIVKWLFKFTWQKFRKQI